MRQSYILSARVNVRTLRDINMEKKIKAFCNDIMGITIAILAGCVFAFVMIWAAR